MAQSLEVPPPPEELPDGQSDGPVGGEIYPVDKAALLVPWIALAAVIIAGGVFLVRRKAYR